MSSEQAIQHCERIEPALSWPDVIGSVMIATRLSLTDSGQRERAKGEGGESVGTRAWQARDENA